MEDGRMKRQVTLITLIVLLLLPNVVQAYWNCDYTRLAKLKAYAANINTSYDYKMVDNTPKFTITITNIYKTMILYDNTSKKYYYPDTSKDMTDFTIDGYENGKSYQFTIYTTEDLCTDKIIYTFYVTLPPYNPYYNDSLCAKYPDYKLCQKWTNTGLTYDKFKTEMSNYISSNGGNSTNDDNENNLPEWVKYYLKYYMLILPAIIVIGGGILYNYYKNDD